MKILFLLLAVGCLLSAASAQWLDTTIAVGANPTALCYNPQNGKVYCANQGDSSITVIDGASNQVITTVAVGSWPHDLCCNQQDNKIYCANERGGTVTVIDGYSNLVDTTVATGDNPWALCYNSQNDKVYCANQGSGNVTVINGTTNQVITNVDLGMGSTPRALCYDTPENKVYVALGPGEVAVIDGRTNQVLARLGVCDDPFRLCYNSDNDEVYCRSWLLQDPHDALFALDGRGDTILYMLWDVGLGGGAIAYYHGTGKIYCANPDSNSVTVIDPVSHHVIGTVAAGLGACALGYSTTNNKVYCANGVDSTVTVINGVTNSVLKTMTVGTRPVALAYNPARNRIYVANCGSNSISVIRDSALGVAERATPAGRCVSLEAYPNPFRDRVRLQLTAIGLRPELRIYDVNGALVRAFAIPHSAFRTPHCLTWDGTDGKGRLLPAGVYVARLTDGASSVNRKVTLLR